MSARPRHPLAASRAPRWTALAAALLLAAAGTPAFAQPDLSRTTGVTLADRGSAHYTFSTLRFSSADGERHYRVRVAVPHVPAPPAGHPVIYLLDGNAALMETDDALLGGLGGDRPVIAFIGYDNDLRIDAAGRAYDYTPRRGDAEARDDQGRRSGGADAFLDLIVERIRPAVAKAAPVDPQRQTLWGHSYGGLFVLHALFTRPESFRTYVAADPSLWWGEGYVLGEERAFAKARRADAAPVIALVVVGRGGERPERPGRDPAAVARMERARSAMPLDAASKLVERLAALPGVDARYRELQGLNHGQTLGASLAPALNLAAESGAR